MGGSIMSGPTTGELPLGPLGPQVMNRITPHLSFLFCIVYHTSSAAQGGGGSFKNRKLMDRQVVGVLLCFVFWIGCNGCSGRTTTTVGCSVV